MNLLWTSPPEAPIPELLCSLDSRVGPLLGSATSPEDTPVTSDMHPMPKPWVTLPKEPAIPVPLVGGNLIQESNTINHHGFCGGSTLRFRDSSTLLHAVLLIRFSCCMLPSHVTIPAYPFPHQGALRCFPFFPHFEQGFSRWTSLSLPTRRCFPKLLLLLLPLAMLHI